MLPLRPHPAGHEAETQTGTGPGQQLGRALLNIGWMGPGRAGYYLTAVAKQDGAEGYYLARGEEPGRWLGTGAEHLGLSGEVTGPQLRAVLDARHPDTGEQLARHPARKVPGFDHTFGAPKSVSLLWALGDRATAAEVVAGMTPRWMPPSATCNAPPGSPVAGPVVQRRSRWRGSWRQRSGIGPQGWMTRCCTPMCAVDSCTISA